MSGNEGGIIMPEVTTIYHKKETVEATKALDLYYELGDLREKIVDMQNALWNMAHDKEERNNIEWLREAAQKHFKSEPE